LLVAKRGGNIDIGFVIGGTLEKPLFDLDEKTISTTRASDQNRSTVFSSVMKSDGLIHFQGLEGGRAFGIVINETTGHMTAAVLRDGLSVSVFGVCTDADI